MALRTAESRLEPGADSGSSGDGETGRLSRVRRAIARARLAVWRQWLWLVAIGAVFDWRQWLAVIGLVLGTIVGILFAPNEKPPRYGLDHEFAINSPEFVATIAGATDTPFLPGNRIDILNNGDEIYPAVLEAVATAKQTITVEAYIYWEGDIGMRFAQALAAKRREGVTVKVLLDAVGSSAIGDAVLDVMKESGCDVRWYRPLNWYSFERVNHRTHRKSIIIDGRVGFTGGAGIADQWLGNAEDPDHWRDIQVRIEGPAVSPLQTGFARNWLEAHGELVSGDGYYPPIEKSGPFTAQSILSSPESGSSTVRIMYYLSIACARKSIFIANPYFVPDEPAIEALIAAKQRGVDVKIMVTGEHNDNLIARHNSVRLYGELLEAGVEIYEYNQTMLHQKYMVCDGIWTTIGTTNFDNRSFALNEENNLCVYDVTFAGQFETIFRNDLAGCDRIDLATWGGRGIVTRVSELLASLVRDQV